MLKFDGHVDVLVLLHTLHFFIIHCIVWFLLNQSFEHSNLVEDSIHGYHMILQYLVSLSCVSICVGASRLNAGGSYLTMVGLHGEASGCM